MRDNKGITLIALVITIIVLIILAGIALVALAGDNGIIKKAQEAKDKTNESINQEINAMDNIIGTLNQIENGGETIPTNPGEPNDSGYFTKNSTINGRKVAYNNPVIPKGFKPISTADDVSVTSSWNKTTLIQADTEKGLVIQDAQANQFVWVPVPDMSKFKRTEGYASGALTASLPNTGEADATGINTNLQSIGKAETEATKQEAIAMYDSVRKNQGFYIGRFETGIERNGSNIKTVVRKNASTWVNMRWYDTLNSNTEIGGAVGVSRGMYTDKNQYGATSTLCYGVQWDAALNFIDNNYITNELEDKKPNCASDSYIVNSSGKGNYSGSGINTGSNDNYRVKNIYDMAGNIWEWTMESAGANRTIRGGLFLVTGDTHPASFRSNDNAPSTVSPYIASRMTLYIDI